jgi:hypothetical protein
MGDGAHMMNGLDGSYKTGKNLCVHMYGAEFEVDKETGKVFGNIRRVGVYALVRKKTLRIHMQYLRQPGAVEGRMLAKANRVAQQPV